MIFFKVLVNHINYLASYRESPVVSNKIYTKYYAEKTTYNKTRSLHIQCPQ